MKLFQLGIVKLFFRGEPQASPDELRILNLFRNRAELKKAHSELQKEVYRLKDRIKQQEGVTQRVQEQLGALEERLSFVETGYSALVFYQLRRLWRTGRDLIEELVDDLAQRQEQHERQQHFSAHAKQQATRLEAAEREQSSAQQRLDACGAKLTELMSRREQLNKLWHYFARRQLAQPISAAQSEQLEADAALRQARTLLQELQQEPVPDFPGLSLQARRAINLRAIAYSELLCTRLAGGELLRRAREAAASREAGEEYGTRPECEALMLKIEEALARLKDRSDVSEEIRSRTDRLRKVVRYRNAADTAPVAESLLGRPEGEEATSITVPAPPLNNVLAEDTWDIYKVLLR